MKKIFLRPKDRQRTSNPKKASQEYYLCSSNRILTGRRHSGDENGKTWFEDAGLEAVDESGNIVSGEISVTSVEWSEWSKESSGQGFDALNNRVLVGREHRGDENGKTRYATAIVLFNGKICMTTDRVSSSRIRESKGIWCCSDSERVMTGRHHSGDENGRTYYNFSKIFSLEPNTEPAPKDTKIIPDKRMQSESMKESNSSFLCPPNMVLTGRFHSGDENGITIYEYASLKAISADGEVVCLAVGWRLFQNNQLVACFPDGSQGDDSLVYGNGSRFFSVVCQPGFPVHAVERSGWYHAGLSGKLCFISGLYGVAVQKLIVPWKIKFKSFSCLKYWTNAATFP